MFGIKNKINNFIKKATDSINNQTMLSEEQKKTQKIFKNLNINSENQYGDIQWSNDKTNFLCIKKIDNGVYRLFTKDYESDLLGFIGDAKLSEDGNNFIFKGIKLVKPKDDRETNIYHSIDENCKEYSFIDVKNVYYDKNVKNFLVNGTAYQNTDYVNLIYTNTKHLYVDHTIFGSVNYSNDGKYTYLFTYYNEDANNKDANNKDEDENLYLNDNGEISLVFSYYNLTEMLDNKNITIENNRNILDNGDNILISKIIVCDLEGNRTMLFNINGYTIKLEDFEVYNRNEDGYYVINGNDGYNEKEILTYIDLLKDNEGFYLILKDKLNNKEEIINRVNLDINNNRCIMLLPNNKIKYMMSSEKENGFNNGLISDDKRFITIGKNKYLTKLLKLDI